MSSFTPTSTAAPSVFSNTTPQPRSASPLLRLSSANSNSLNSSLALNNRPGLGVRTSSRSSDFGRTQRDSSPISINRSSSATPTNSMSNQTVPKINRISSSPQSSNIASSPLATPLHAPQTLQTSQSVHATVGTPHRASPVGNTARMAQLESENIRLRGELSQLKNSNTPRKHGIMHDEAVRKDIQRTLTSMLLGKEYNLSKFRSMSDKLQLLRRAIELHDGDIITKVVLFMKQTLKETLFTRFIIQPEYSVAVDHYCAYLKQSGDVDTLIEVLQLLNRNDESVYLKYEQVLFENKNSPDNL